MIEEFKSIQNTRTLYSTSRNTLGGYTCYKCKRTLPRTPEYFPKNKNKPDGLTYICKECMKKYTQERRKNGN